jgi:hypothetical protein
MSTVPKSDRQVDLSLTGLSMSTNNLRNVYFVYLKRDEDQFGDGKVAVRETSYYYEPPEPVWCGDLFVASSPGKARVEFLKHFKNVCYIEDWVNIRVRKVGIVTGMIEGTKGMYNYGNPQFDQFWGRIHEILDHDGEDCDCTMEDE